MAYLWLENPAQIDAALAALADVPHLRSYKSDALPGELRAYRPGRSGHLTLISEPPYVLAHPTRAQSLAWSAGKLAGAVRGNHGYLPDHPDMGGIFYAIGRAVPAGTALPAVRAIDVAPTIARRDGNVEARWAAALSASEDAGRVTLLARSMSPASHAVPVARHAEATAWAPDALLHAFLDATVDALVRSTQGAPTLPRVASWDSRWQAALSGAERSFETRGFGERTLASDLERWSTPALGGRDRLRACFRLELPESDRAPFTLRFLLQSADDPSLLVPASDVWAESGRSLSRLGREFRDPHESLLEALGRAARLFPPLAAALEIAKPESLTLDAAGAWTFLGEGAPVLGAVIPSNELQIRQAMERVLAARKRRVGVVGLAFKPGTDDLRESPMVRLVETLIGKGLDVRILDRNVSIARLVGANRRYIEEEIPHIASLMCDDAKALLEHAEVVVLGSTSEEAVQTLERIEGRAVVDLTRGVLPRVHSHKTPAPTPRRSAVPGQRKTATKASARVGA